MKKAISIFQERAKRRPLVLVVDDEVAILDLLGVALPTYGIDLKLALHLVTAVRTFKQQKEKLEAALIDVQMPEYDGPMVLDMLRVVKPSLKACFMTGFSGHHSPES